MASYDHKQPAADYALENLESNQAATASSKSGSQPPEPPNQNLVEALPQIVWTADREGAITYLSSRWYEYSGSSQLLPNQAFYEGLHPANREQTIATWHQTIHHLKPFQLELQLRQTDGTYHWFIAQGVPRLDQQGQIQQWVGMLINVDQWQQSETTSREQIISRLQGKSLQALQESEERYRSLVLATAQIIWNADADGKVTTPIASWCAFTGQSDAAVQGSGWLDAVHPADRAHSLRAWKQALAAKTLYQTEYRLRRADGSYRHFTVCGVPILRQDGSIREWVGICTDITEQKQRFLAEHFLAEAAQELGRSLDYRTTLASITRLAVPQLADWAAVSVVEEDGSVRQLEVAHIDPQKVSLAWELYRRYPDRPNSAYGVRQVIRTGKPELVSEIADEVLAAVATTPEHWQILQSLGLKSYMVVPLVARGRTLGAITFITAESNRRYSQSDLSFAQSLADRAALAIDNARLFQAVEQELIERRYMQSALQESENRFRAMADSAPILLWVAGTDSLRNFFNQEWLQFTGRTLEQELGTGWAEGIHPDDLQHCLNTYLTAFNTHQPFELEYRLRRADGEYRWMFDRGVPRFAPDESFNGYIGSCIDITERKQAQETLQARADELVRITKTLARTTTSLEKRNQELDQFAYVVSHDLKAPLRAIANLSQWIEEDLNDSLTDETRHQMNLMRGRVQRMENLINGLLQYSRVGRTEAQQETVDVRLLLQDIIDSIAPPEGFTIDIQSGMPTLHTHRLRLEQVFTNLISNAIKHHDRATGHLQITVSDQSSFYEFGVTDDGPGIAPEYHQKVFGIFQTLEARDKVENTGIGLSLVKKIVEGRGGTVQIASQPGQGTTFLFTWPK